MDGKRFDSLARTIGRRRSRRDAVPTLWRLLEQPSRHGSV